MNLIDLGYNDYFKTHFDKLENKELIPARVSCEQRNLYTVLSEHGELTAEVSGKFRHNANSRADYPSVGDWVAVRISDQNDSVSIHHLLNRKSVFSRKAVLGSDKTDQQILAANVDTAFLVSGLDNEFNIRRIERYLAATWDSGASPVIVLNKSELCEDIESVVSEVENSALGIPVIPVSAILENGLDILKAHIEKYKTIVFLGSSGVGKSTLINKLIGDDRQVTSNVREDDSRGRHTTTYRELIPIPDGGLLIDTPGMREIQMWGDEESLKKAFDDIEALAESCRFRDCDHNSEPSCAVKQAIKDGSLKPKRFKNFKKQQRELIKLNIRKSDKARHIEKLEGRKFAVMIKEVQKRKQNRK